MAAAATMSRLRGSKEAKSVDELEADLTEGHAVRPQQQQQQQHQQQGITAARSVVFSVQ